MSVGCHSTSVISRGMCVSSASGVGSGDVDEKAKEAAKRSEMLRKTLASLKSVPRAQVVQHASTPSRACSPISSSGVSVSELASEIGKPKSSPSSSSSSVSSSSSSSPDEPRFWTTRPEPKSANQGPAKPNMTWGEWIKSPEAIKASVKHEWEHYRDGSKLLYYNMVATKQIVGRKLKGQSLTRREYQLMVRTASDLFRLVPFAVIVVVPFMEFSLPVLLKLFPNMLPSTFTSKLQQKEQLKKQLNLKIEMARFLQDTLVEMKADSASTAGTVSFIEKMKSGEGVTKDELVQFAKVFNEDLTLNGLQRNQLTAMCRLLGLQPFGTDVLLIVQIRLKIASIKKDDKAIMAEGVDTLTLEELQHAVLARGMYSQTKNKRVLGDRLRAWLDMSITNNVPITLLILSRAFALNARTDLAQTLKDTFDHMPQELIDEIETRVSGKRLGRRVDRKMKLEALEQFRALIAEERSSLNHGSSSQDLASAAAPFEALATLTQPTELERLQIKELRAQVESIKADINDDVKALQVSLDAMNAKLNREQEAEYAELLQKRAALASASSSSSTTAGATTVTSAAHSTFTTTNATGTASTDVSSTSSSITSEGASEISSSVAAVEKLETDEEFHSRWAQKRNDVLASELERQTEREAEKKNVKALEARIGDMLAQLDTDVVETKKQLEEDLKVLDRNYDGLISEDELKFALTALNAKLTDEQVQAVLEKLDANHDGLIEVDHLFKVARELHIDLNSAIEEAKAKEASIIAKTAEATEPQQ